MNRRVCISMSKIMISTIDMEFIPQELKTYKQWVVHNSSKQPIDPRNGRRLTWTKSVYWMDYEAARSAVESGRAAGVGFVLTDDDPYTIIDLDGLRNPETGVLDDAAKQIIAEMNSFTEVSLSGTGLHVIIRGKSPDGAMKKIRLDHVPLTSKKSPGLEVYSNKRYFALTGKHLSGTPEEIHDRQDELNAMLEHFKMICQVVTPTNVDQRPKPRPSQSDRTQIIERARRYLSKIPGAVSGQDGHNQTFVAALKVILGFDLSREESWNIISEWNQTCDPPWSDEELWHKIDDVLKSDGERGRLLNENGHQNEFVNVNVQNSPIPKNSISSYGDLKKKTNQHELEAAKRFSIEHGQSVFYVHAWKHWIYWDGQRWNRDDCGYIESLAKRTVERILLEAAQTANKNAVNYALRMASARGIAAILKLAESSLPIDYQKLDSNQWLLNCSNGTIDLRTGELNPHSPRDLITKLCPIEYDPSANKTVWNKFLKSLFDSQEDIEFLRRLIGYCLTGDVSEQSIVILWGDGSNGKSVFVEALLGTFGRDFSMTAAPELLLESNSNRHPTEQADLFGQRLVVASETDSGRRLAEATVKTLTGGDRIRARRMREDFWEFNPTHKIMLLTNHKPRVIGTDHGIWRRLRLIPFEKRFWDPDKGESGLPELKADKRLSDKLRECQAGILTWAVEGCLEWQKVGLGTSLSISRATEEYRNESDVMARFVEECCITQTGKKVQALVLREALNRFCDENGDEMPSPKEAAKWLEGKFKKKKSGCIWYQGIALKDSVPC